MCISYQEMHILFMSYKGIFIDFVDGFCRQKGGEKSVWAEEPDVFLDGVKGNLLQLFCAERSTIQCFQVLFQLTDGAGTDDDTGHILVF